MNTALEIAKKEHKNIMVMVEGKHCTWCKKMKTSTLVDERVEKRLEKYVLVKVMRSDGSAMSKLPPMEGIPTTFFMKEDKAIIEDLIGYYNVEEFLFNLNKIEKEEN